MQDQLLQHDDDSADPEHEYRREHAGRERAVLTPRPPNVAARPRASRYVASGAAHGLRGTPTDEAFSRAHELFETTALFADRRREAGAEEYARKVDIAEGREVGGNLVGRAAEIGSLAGRLRLSEDDVVHAHVNRHALGISAGRLHRVAIARHHTDQLFAREGDRIEPSATCAARWMPAGVIDPNNSASIPMWRALFKASRSSSGAQRKGRLARRFSLDLGDRNVAMPRAVDAGSRSLALRCATTRLAASHRNQGCDTDCGDILRVKPKASKRDSELRPLHRRAGWSVGGASQSIRWGGFADASV